MCSFYLNLAAGTLPCRSCGAAMVVNDNASKPDKRGVLESIAGKPAPTGNVWTQKMTVCTRFCRSWLASEDGRGACSAIKNAFASKPAPTVSRDCVKNQKKDTGQSCEDINPFASWNVSDAEKLRP